MFQNTFKIGLQMHVFIVVIGLIIIFFEKKVNLLKSGNISRSLLYSLVINGFKFEAMTFPHPHFYLTSAQT